MTTKIKHFIKFLVEIIFSDKREQSHAFINLKSIDYGIKKWLFGGVDVMIILFLIFIIHLFKVSYKIIFFHYLSNLIIFIIFLNNLILSLMIKRFILKYDLSGKWKGKFITTNPFSQNKEEKSEPKSIEIISFEIKDFGENGIIIVKTKNFTSYSIMAKIIQIEENEINLKFMYRVNYQNEEILNNDHYGVTEMTFYKNKLKNDNGEKIAEGFYYSYDNKNEILRTGKIILNKSLIK